MIEDAEGGDGDRKMESPELRPLPPLARQASVPPPPPPREEAGFTTAEEDEDEFYSPRGSSLGGSAGTGSMSRRVFVADRSLTSSSCSSSSSASPERSTTNLPPPASSSYRNTLPKSPENYNHQHMHSSSSSMCSTPDRVFAERDNDASSACAHADAHAAPASLHEGTLEKNENALSSSPPQRLSNASSSSAFSLPSSPDKVTRHNTFDQSPRMSSVSDGLMLHGLSSLPLSPALLSSPETERGTFSELGTASFGAQRKQWSIPALSMPITTPFDEIGNVPAPPPLPQRKHWEIPGPAPPPPPPLPRQRKQWGVPAPGPSTPVGQPVSRPPELVPPSRPFVLQNQATNVELPPSLWEIEETGKPKLKPLHWDKVRTSSEREMAWDQMKSSSFK